MISIIIPVFNGAGPLRHCLSAIRQHAVEAVEVVVVDDGSDDSSAEVAQSYDCRVLRTGRRSGPAAARHLGALAARGDILMFFDADVCVHGDTISRLALALEDPFIGAAFGSYDSDPQARHLVSRFRNLLHHYVHQTASEEASSFWAGCGAVRRNVYFEAGGFDPSFVDSSIEDIELGLRLRKAGHRIVVCKEAQVRHLKRWTLWSMCATDLWRRGVPWSRLILREKSMPNDLNVKQSQRACVALSLILLGLLAAAVWRQPWVVLVPALLLFTIQALDRFESKSYRWACVACGCAAAAGSLWSAFEAPLLLMLGLASVIGVWCANAHFYGFLSRLEGRAFTIAAFPLHLLFYTICGAAFLIAVGEHCLGRPGPGRKGGMNVAAALQLNNVSS